MNRLSVIFLFVISAAHAELPDRQLTATQAAKEITLLSLALETIHPGYGRYTPIPEFEKSMLNPEAGWLIFQQRC
jgi:hypothetical protein